MADAQLKIPPGCNPSLHYSFRRRSPGYSISVIFLTYTSKLNDTLQPFKEHYAMFNFILPVKSEYIQECDKRRAYISGFTGSAGNVDRTNK